MNYYFAYGSNMDETQMQERCPSAKLLGVAVLDNYELAFTIYSPKRECGCADIVRKNGSTVYGLLYQLDDADLARLDTFEGCPIHYQRISVPIMLDGKKMTAETYEVVTKQPGQIPSGHYLGLLRAAAEKYGFPKEYRMLLDAFETN